MSIRSEQHNLAGDRPDIVEKGMALLKTWEAEMLPKAARGREAEQRSLHSMRDRTFANAAPVHTLDAVKWRKLAARLEAAAAAHSG